MEAERGAGLVELGLDLDISLTFGEDIRTLVGLLLIPVLDTDGIVLTSIEFLKVVVVVEMVVVVVVVVEVVVVVVVVVEVVVVVVVVVDVVVVVVEVEVVVVVVVGVVTKVVLLAIAVVVVVVYFGSTAG